MKPLRAPLVTLVSALVCASALMAPARAADNIRSVGIISAVGDTMTKKKVALMVFGNSAETEAIDDWQLDEHLIGEFAAQLGGAYEVKPVAYTKSDFLANKKGIFADSDFDGEKSIARVQRQAGAEPDACITMTKAFCDDRIGRTNQHLFGVGLYHRTVGSGLQAVYVCYEINVIDGRTLKYMTDRYPSGPLDFGVTPDYDRMGYREVSLWSEGFVMTPEQRAQARDGIKALLRGAVSQALKDFRFQVKESPPS